MKKSIKNPILFNKIVNAFLNSYQNRIKAIAATIVVISLVFAMLVSYSGINNLYIYSSKQMKNGLAVANEEYLNNYINITSQLVQSKTQHFFANQAVLTDVYPKVSDNEKRFHSYRNKFKGSISVDFEINEIISYVNSLKIKKTGFAYISQSNRNILAVNKSGEKVLGLKSTYDSTESGKSGVGYNKMQRFLGKSIYSSVKGIKLPINNEVSKSYIEIYGKKYIVIQKKLSPLNTWNKDKGFYKEMWTLGFVVPKQELFEPYDNLRSQINNIKTEILIKQVAITFFIILILGVTIYLLSQRMIRNFKKIENATAHIIEGNYDVYVDIKSNDELGKLALAINKMTAEIKSNFSKLKQQNELLKIEINSRKSKEILIDYLENYDTLTKLPKENLLIKKIEENIYYGSGTIMMIGIDNFRRVNEVIGHEGGNEILKMFSQRLKAISKRASIVSRVNGDEFVVLYDNTTNFDDIIIKVEKIMDTMKDVFVVNNKEIYITESIGISMFPSDSSDTYEIIKYASAALSRAKEIGRGKYIFYDVEINKSNEKRIDLVKNMRHAIANEEFELYYQPQVDIKDKRVIGME